MSENAQFLWPTLEEYKKQEEQLMAFARVASIKRCEYPPSDYDFEARKELNDRIRRELREMPLSELAKLPLSEFRHIPYKYLNERALTPEEQALDDFISAKCKEYKAQRWLELLEMPWDELEKMPWRELDLPPKGKDVLTPKEEAIGDLLLKKQQEEIRELDEERAAYLRQKEKDNAKKQNKS